MMVKFASRAAVLFVAFVGLAATPALAADNLPISAFFGEFQGSGVSETTDSIYFAVTQRDMDVSIRPEGDGFTVKWVTVTRQSGDPNNPNVKRKERSLTFKASSLPGIFKGVDKVDPMTGDYYWARISGNSLFVYVMTVAEDGKFQVQVYERTLSGTGMQLRFTRIRDGEPVRTVDAKLVKVAN